MYHRVTSRRPGLRSEPWIDEIMAFLAAQWFLRCHGYHDFARRNRRHYVTRKLRVDTGALRQFRRPKFFIVTKDRADYFPENFYPGVCRVAVVLNWVVPSNDLLRLPWAGSLDEWLHSLPEESHTCVCSVLELPEKNDGILLTEDWRVKMGRHCRFLDALMKL